MLWTLHEDRGGRRTIAMEVQRRRRRERKKWKDCIKTHMRERKDSVTWQAARTDGAPALHKHDPL